VRRDEGLARGQVLHHPDCPRCGTRPRSQQIACTIGELRSEPAPIASAEQIAQALGHSPFAPLRVEEVTGAPGQFPFDQPYVFGDTRLSRLRVGRVFCTSMPGFVHGSCRSVDQSRMLAWSEGAERLGAQGATPDLVLAADDPRVVEAYRPFGGRPPRNEAHALCVALDLIRGNQCLVPFERVAVAIPRELMWGGSESDSTFTGCASHVTSVASILHATVELLKRDAYMIGWYRKRCLPEIEWPRSLPHDLDERVRYLHRHGMELRLYDLRADLPLPMVMLHVRARRHLGHFPAGGSLLVPAGGFTALEALEHALKLTCSRFAGLAFEDAPERDPLDPDAVARLGGVLPFWPGLARYLDPRNAAALDFLPGGERTVLEALNVAEQGSRFALLRTWLVRARLTWMAVSLDSAASLDAGLRVIKVVVPEALRLTMREQKMDRLHPRLAREWPGSTIRSWNQSPLPSY
jgi:YcaO cyclodehydratase, ATP-ad Mg2+-binding